MSTRTRPTPPAPTEPLDPERDGATRVFRSRDHLAAWVRSLTPHPQALRSVTPRHLGDLSATVAHVAQTAHGGAVLIELPRDHDLRGWLDEVRLEHGPSAIDGPWPVRVGGDAGWLIAVVPSEAPTTWETWEPDAWPVPQAEPSPFDGRRVQTFMRSLTFARPVDRTEADHEAETLLRFGALRWFRGRLVPTVAGLVAFGEATDRHLPGSAVALRGPDGQEQRHRGALPWLAQRITEERRFWGAVPPEVARAVLVLALAERAWAGPDAATPITISVDARHLRLAIPTRAANPLEEEVRAPGNPRLRILLVRAGLLPAVPGVETPDNDEVLGQLAGRWPGVRCRYEDDVTWLEVPLQAGAVVVPRAQGSASIRPRMLQAPPVAESAAGNAPVVSTPAVPSAPAAMHLPNGVSTPEPARAREPATLSASRPASVQAAPVTAPTQAPQVQMPRAAPRRAPPIFHARSSDVAPAPIQARTAPGQADGAPQEAPALSALPASVPPALTAPPPPSPAEPAAPPAPSPPAGPLTLDERKAQLRAVLVQADRPLGARELAEALGVHRDTLTPAIKALIADGWLAPTDPNPRSPVQRYRRVGD